MQKNLLAISGGGLISALLWAGAPNAAGNLMIFAYLAPLPVMVIGLGWGPGLGALSIVTGFVLALFFSNLVFGALYGLIIGLPSWIMIRLAMIDRRMPDGSVAKLAAGPILGRFSGFAAGFLLIVALAHLGTEGGFQGAVEGYLDQIMTDRFHLLGAAQRGEFADLLHPFFPALLIILWLAIVVLNTVVAQTVLTRAGKNNRQTPAYAHLQIQEWSYWALVCTAAVSLIGSGGLEYLARNMVMVLGVPFFFAGLAVLHVLVRRLPASGAILMGFYMILFIFGWAALLTAALGFFEPWTNLRRRFGYGPGPRKEEEE